MVGGLADDWTLESVEGETILRVGVVDGQLGEAFSRASLTLRTLSGRRAWARLGADRLEVRSEGVALSLEVMKGTWP